jgi:hypothetical protein
MLSFALRLILCTLFFPAESSFFIFGLRFTVTRLIFIILTPVVFTRFIGKIVTGRYHLVASDVFVPMAAIWMFVGPTVRNGFDDALAHSGPIALEYLIGYLSTRVLLSESGEALRFIDLLCFVIFIVVLVALLDPITGRYLTHELFGQISGYVDIRYNEDSYRFGMLRAAGPIEHSILFGYTCVFGLILAVAVDVRRRILCITACAVGVLISFSSGPVQCAMLGFGLLLYSRMFAGLPHKWFMLSIIPILTVVSLFLVTSTPFGHLFDLLTIDPMTAYYRLYIWNLVGPAILQSPFFAVLESTYDYQGSVDSVWLVLSLTYGMPCAILVALSMMGSCSLPTNGPRARLSTGEERLGTALGIVIFLIIFMGFTTHFWGSVWILVSLLIGTRAHLGEMGRLNEARSFAGVLAYE